jgi:hypothetical protein
VFEGDPGLLAAGGSPTPDRLQNGFGLLAAERPINVDHKQRRPFAESGPSAEPAGGEYGLVALGGGAEKVNQTDGLTERKCQPSHLPLEYTRRADNLMRPMRLGGTALASGRVKRRLAAILAADVAGYSRFTGSDEVGTLQAL